VLTTPINIASYSWTGRFSIDNLPVGVSTNPLTPSTSWGGDLGGTGTSPTVINLSISGMQPGDLFYVNTATQVVRLAAGATNEYLSWDGSGIPTGKTVVAEETYTGDMEKSTYDTNDNGVVDSVDSYSEADPLSLHIDATTDLGGAGDNTISADGAGALNRGEYMLGGDMIVTNSPASENAGLVEGQMQVVDSYGSANRGSVSPGTATMIVSNSYGSANEGDLDNGGAEMGIYSSHGSRNRGAVGDNGGMTIASAHGALIAGYAQNGTFHIGPNAHGAQILGHANMSPPPFTVITNAGAGTILLVHLGQTGTASASSDASGSIGLGQVTLTHKSAIVAGDGESSNGDGSITASGGFYGALTGGVTMEQGDILTMPGANATVYSNVVVLYDGDERVNWSTRTLKGGAWTVDGGAAFSANLTGSTAPASIITSGTISNSRLDTDLQALAGNNGGSLTNLANEVLPVDDGNVSGTWAIDFTAGGVQKAAQTGSITSITYTVSSTNNEAALVMELHSNGSSITWPTNITSFATNAAPSLVSNEWNRLIFSGYRGRYHVGHIGSAP